MNSPYVFDAWHLDTTPGKPSQIFSPPQGWEGDDIKYLEWLRIQFKNSHCFKERIGCAARSKLLNRPIKIEGPYQKALESVLHLINEKMRRFD